MTIFRIENSNGIGPYVGNKKNEILFQMNVEHSSCPLHPMPLEENLSMDRDFDLCGFESIEKLKKWFDGWINRLYDNGFFAVQIEINSHFVKIGSFQVIFKKNCIKTKKQLSLETLKELLLSN